MQQIDVHDGCTGRFTAFPPETENARKLSEIFTAEQPSSRRDFPNPLENNELTRLARKLLVMSKGLGRPDTMREQVMRVSKIGAKHVWFGLLAAAAFSSPAIAEPILITVAGTYEYTGAAPSPTANFTLSFTLERSPAVCGGSPGAFIACGPSLPHYTNGTLDVTLGAPTVLFRDAANGGGLSLFQDDLALNRLGFVIGSGVLFSGTLAAPTLVDGVYAITGAHCGGDPQLMGDLCSYAGQGFASGDPINNPFHDPITLQSDDPILSGTITIASVAAVPEPATLAVLGAGLAGFGFMRRRRAA